MVTRLGRSLGLIRGDRNRIGSIRVSSSFRYQTFQSAPELSCPITEVYAPGEDPRSVIPCLVELK